MSQLQLPINGLTHHDVKERREEFVGSAMGQTVMLVAMPIAEDLRCVAAYVDGLRIGNVKGDHVLAAQRALLASPMGVVTGRFMDVSNDGYCLMADFGEVPMVGAEDVERMLPLGLGSWTCSVPTMSVPPQMQQAGVMLKLLWASVEGNLADQIPALSEQLFRLMRYDLSQEMRRERGLLVQRLLQSADGRLQRAAARLEEAISRMGGETQMTEVGEWLQKTVVHSREAELLLAQSQQLTRQKVLAEAAALPGNLLHLWQTSGRDFASVLYGMRLSREDVLRVVSCLVWLERTEGETADNDSITLRELADRVIDEKDKATQKELQNAMLHLFDEDPRWAAYNADIKERLYKREHESGSKLLMQGKAPLTTSDKDIKKALEALLGLKDVDGKPVLRNKKQWWAVFRVLSTFCNYPQKMTSFVTKINDLGLDRTDDSTMLTYESLCAAPKDVPQMNCSPAAWDSLKEKSENYRQQYTVAEFLMLKLGIKS